MTVIEHTKTKPGQDLLAAFTTYMRATFAGSESAGLRADARDLGEAKRNIDDLMDKIDHGYEIAETGARAEIPRFARTSLKQAIRCGDV